MKRVFIIHGWEGYPEEGWFPWLKKGLEKNGFEVAVPKMPEAKRPNIEKWLSKIGEIVGTPDEKTYFVGHSIGANAVMRYIESLAGKRVGGAVLVAPYFGKINLESGEAEKIARPWLENNINFSKIKKSAGNIVVIFSDNDEWVPLGNKEFFKKNLSPKIIIEHDKGHINGEAGVNELPSALAAILSFS